VADCRTENGFVLIVTCIALTVLLGFAALGVDVGRMYVIKSELQAFTDAAALSAALELDGSSSGIARAREAAARLTKGPNAMKWDMGTRAITLVRASFAPGESAPDQRSWQAEPKNAGDYRFVRVEATAPASLVFMRLFQPRAEATVASSSVAVTTAGQARLVE